MRGIPKKVYFLGRRTTRRCSLTVSFRPIISSISNPIQFIVENVLTPVGLPTLFGNLVYRSNIVSCHSIGMYTYGIGGGLGV